jgi:lycopene cyclase domain-containing protein
VFGHFTYLVLELAWALPVLALQWTVGLPELWRARRIWITASLLPTVYLWLADRFALGNGIWQIAGPTSTGIQVGGLPLEEAVFFLLTNVMIVQGLLLAMSDAPLARVRGWLRGASRAVPALGRWGSLTAVGQGRSASGEAR